MKRFGVIGQLRSWDVLAVLVLLIAVAAFALPLSRGWLLAPIVTNLEFDRATTYTINKNGSLTIVGALSEPGTVTLLIDGLPIRSTATFESGPEQRFIFEQVTVGDAIDRIALGARARVGWAILRTRTAAFTAQVDTSPLLDVTRATTADRVEFRGMAAPSARLRVTAFPTDSRQSSATASTTTAADTDGRFHGVVALPVPGAYFVTASDVSDPTRTSASISVTRLVAPSAEALHTVAVLGPYQRRIDCEIGRDLRIALRFELPATDPRLDAYRRGEIHFGEFVALVYGVTRVNELTLSELFSRTEPFVSVADGRAVVSATSPSGVYSDAAYPGYFRGSVKFRQEFLPVGVARYTTVVDDVLTIHPEGFNVATVTGDQYDLDKDTGTYTWRGVSDGRLTRYVELETSSRPWSGVDQLKQFLTSSPADFLDPSKRARPALLDDALRGLLIAAPAFWTLVLLRRQRLPGQSAGENVRIAAAYAIALGVAGPFLLGLLAIGTLWSRHAAMMLAIDVSLGVAALGAAVIAVIAFRRGAVPVALRIPLWIACLVGVTAAVCAWVNTWPGESIARQAVIDLLVVLPTSTALVSFASFTITLVSRRRVPRAPFVLSLLLGALIAIPLPYLNDSMALDASGWPRAYDALNDAWGNALWIVRPLFAICVIAWLREVRDLPVRTRFEIGTLLFACYVGGSTRLLVGLPLYMVAAALVFRNLVVSRVKREAPPVLSGASAVEEAAQSYDIAISRAIINAKHRHLSETRSVLWDDLLRGAINAKEYKERKEALDAILDTVPPSERHEGDANAIGYGPGASDFENASIAARWSTIFILPFFWFSLKAFAFDAQYARPFPLLASVSDFLNAVLDVVLPAFIFGYAFRMIRGETGLSKGVWTFCAVVLSVGLSWLLTLSSPVAIGVTLVLTFFYYVGIGGAFDLVLVKKARGEEFTLLDLGYAQGWTPMVSRMAPMLAFIAVLVTSVGGIFAKELIPEVAKVLAPGVAATASASGNSTTTAKVGVVPPH